MKMKLLAIVALFCATQSAFGVTCAITSGSVTSRVPVWAHFVTVDDIKAPINESQTNVGTYVEVAGPDKILRDKRTGKEIGVRQGYGQLLVYTNSSPFCSLSDPELKAYGPMYSFATRKGYNSSNALTIKAGTMALLAKDKITDFSAYVNNLARSASKNLQSFADTAGARMQGVGDKINTQIQRATDSAAGQRLQSGLQSVGQKFDTVGQKIATGTNAAADRFGARVN